MENLWPKFTIVNLLPYLDILKEQGKFHNDITSYRLITDIERYDNSKELNQSEIQYNYCIKNNSFIEYDGGYDIKVNIMRINYNLITSKLKLTDLIENKQYSDIPDLDTFYKILSEIFQKKQVLIGNLLSLWGK